jgi:hypothetical protein
VVLLRKPYAGSFELEVGQQKTPRTDVHGVFLSGTRGSKLGPSSSPNIGFSRFDEGLSTHRPNEEKASISVFSGLSQKRCSKCSKFTEKLREIEVLLSSGQVEKAHALVREVVDVLKHGNADS